MPEMDVVVEDANSPASYLPPGARQPSPPSSMSQMDPSSDVVRQSVIEMDTSASTAPYHSISQPYNAVTRGLPSNKSRERSVEQHSVPLLDQTLNPRSDLPLNMRSIPLPTPPSDRPGISHSTPSSYQFPIVPSSQPKIPAPDRHSADIVPAERPSDQSFNPASIPPSIPLAIQPSGRLSIPPYQQPIPPSDQRAIQPSDHLTVPPSDKPTSIPGSDELSDDTAGTGRPTIWRRLRTWITWKIWCLVAVVIALVISIPLGWTLRLRDFTVPDPPEDNPVGIFSYLI